MKDPNKVSNSYLPLVFRKQSWGGRNPEVWISLEVFKCFNIFLCYCILTKKQSQDYFTVIFIICTFMPLETDGNEFRTGQSLVQQNLLYQWKLPENISVRTWSLWLVYFYSPLCQVAITLTSSILCLFHSPDSKKKTLPKNKKLLLLLKLFLGANQTSYITFSFFRMKILGWWFFKRSD